MQEGKLEKITLAKLPQEIMQKLGAKTNGLLLSQATLKEHLERHPEINLLDYSSLPFLIRDTNVYKVKESKENHIVYFSKFGSYYKAVFKVTQNKEEVFLVSLSKGNKKNMKLPTPNLTARSRFLTITLSEMANPLTRSRADGYFGLSATILPQKD